MYHKNYDKHQKHTHKKRSIIKDIKRHIKDIIALSNEPIAIHEIVETIKNDSDFSTSEIRKEIDHLIQSKTVTENNQCIELGSPKYKDLKLKCTIHVTNGGFGYAKAIDSQLIDSEIFIPRAYIKSSMNGDEIIISKIYETEKGLEGVVESITQRKLLSCVVTVSGFVNQKFIATNNNIPNIRFIVNTNKIVNIGDQLLVNIHWNNIDNNEFEVSVIQEIGNVNDPSKDNDVAILEYNILNKFSADIDKEVEVILENRFNFLEDSNRENFRDKLTITIDPETSKDFDDGICVEKTENGTYLLYVHIADVTHYVKPGSCIDEEAKNRCNSTYFPGTVVPMLPFALSDDVCSLIPNEDRPTASIVIEIDKHGNAINYRVTKGIINSKRRFTYQEAKNIIDSNESSVYKDMLMLCCELFQIMNSKKLKDGYVNIVNSEVKIIVDETGDPIDVQREEYDISHQIIEAFMVKSNEMISEYVYSKLKKPSIFRIHEKPNPRNMEVFVEKLKHLGIHISNDPSSKELNDLLHKFRDTELFNLISIDYIQHMNQAEYSSKNKGHHGLNLKFYSHFTSPIRRYSDLLLHRLAFNSDIIDEVDIDKIAEDCSIKERISAKAEKQSVRMKKLRLLKKYVNQNYDNEYEAVVNRIFGNKIFAEIQELQLPIVIFLGSLKDDFYKFDEVSKVLIGQSRNNVISRGAILTLNVTKVDLIDCSVSTIVKNARKPYIS